MGHLLFERVFSTEGVHPYDEVTWELRDVAQTNWKTGETVFEQKGVEFPDFWSMNASTIVTTKYFRGALGTPQREHSLKQLISRVVDAYTAAGVEHGYFATDQDATVFSDELTWMLLHQVFSFNSPVWFNVGTPSPQQVSACQPYDALVTTEHGLQRIGDLHEKRAVGAVVATAGDDAMILATKHNGRKEVLRIRTTSGHEIDVTADHLVWVDGRGFVPAGDIRVGDQVTWHRQHARIPAMAMAPAKPKLARAVGLWSLLDRGADAVVPELLFTADLEVVTIWLRSVFQADGFVSLRPDIAQVGLRCEGEVFARGVQALLSRFGVFSRVGRGEDSVGGRSARWVVSIVGRGDQELFAEHVGFVSYDKRQQLQECLERDGGSVRASERLRVESVTSRGVMDVYDIQTTEGEYLTAGGIRVHNCFILSVDDSMESILNWYREEGLIFKGGSGAGVNLSRIRSSKELLSSGGVASGPVSFMRGADASAGTIKSGGANRRSAKMVVLDVDHPDIVEFVDTKAREEDKIRALRDAGFDMDLGGTDIVSVQYQNANNSVRVSDEFMRAVEAGGSFGLRARVTGEVLEEVDARALFDRIAKAAWECADPGLQYDDTINAWHTNPETGRITASNPCFVGDTLVAVADGRGAVPIRELAEAGEDVPVFSCDVDGNISVGQLTRTRITRYNAPIVRVTLDDGSFVRVTPDHPLMLRDGTFREAQSLQPGDQLMPFEGKVSLFGAHERRTVRAGGSWEQQHQLVGAAVTGEGNPNYRHGMFNGQGVEVTRPCPQCGVEFTSIARQHTCSIKCRDEWRAANPQVVVLACSECGSPFEASRHGRLYCGNECARLAQLRRRTAVTKECPHCHGHFDTFTMSVVYCSRSCASRARWDREGRVSDQIYTCEHCGSGFRPRRRESRYCDSSCAARARVAAQRAYPFVSNHRVVSVVADGFEDVFDGEVPGFHNFAVVTRVVGDDVRRASWGGVFARQCSEFLSLDDSSCNLSSLNLLKFLRSDDSFDTGRFVKAVELIITAMDISICFADFPTEAITRTTRDYRQLGIGYANLGALLMAMGRGYDSEGGRSLAAAITSLMTGAAYRRSAELARVVGPYVGYERNATAHQKVMRKHRLANDELHVLEEDRPVHQAASAEWEQVVALGATHGFRNAQASLLAPTGTIGFMMDCDTTGIEPDFSLVKFKKLVGGGSMQIVNQTVPRALHGMGYGEATVTKIVEFISEHGHVVGAPGLKEEHYEVFDTAMGERAIKPMGHVRMMAAVQPFLSGAISKTVNLPESATVEDIADVYLEGWKLGLKALAVYRDNCKVGQPLSDAKKQDDDAKTEAEVRVEYRPQRRRLPKSRLGRTTSFTVGGAEGYMTSSQYDDGRLGELFLKLGKQGSTLAGVMDAFSIAISIALQYGVPLETYVQKFTNLKFEPAGMTDDPDMRMAQSIIDYVFRRLALDYLDFEARAELGVYSAEERATFLDTGNYQQPQPTEPDEPAGSGSLGGGSGSVGSSVELAERFLGRVVDAPLCLTCGTRMRPSGACFVCEGCGSSSGCS